MSILFNLPVNAFLVIILYFLLITCADAFLNRSRRKVVVYFLTRDNNLFVVF